VTEGANFWSAFYLPLLDAVRAGAADVTPTFITEYLNVHGAAGEVRVDTGAWNTGWHHGRGFTQWTGSEAQRDMLERYGEASAKLHTLADRAAAEAAGDEDLTAVIEEARWRLLRAETSCNIFWGEAWVHRAEVDLEAVQAALKQAQERLDEPSAEAG
jgi:alpha-amylase/alpha-mannosidase (GH57 family)